MKFIARAGWLILQSAERCVVLQGTVVVIRGEGPKGGPGMPEMLTPTSAIMGAGLGKVLTTMRLFTLSDQFIYVSKLKNLFLLCYCLTN